MDDENIPQTPTPFKSPKGNVLIIEDDPDTAEVLMLTLATIGYGVRAAPNRDQAVDRLSHYIYQVVIMDYFMPGMNAREFITLARRRSPLTEVVLTTAGARTEAICKELGLRYALKKPFEAGDVLELLQCIEGKHKAV